ncbi:hypothetical protein LCGC14_0737620 [marine sediment metagenome]|uniref:Uncharacterized protein n=1 Tax=marine sediment metagenome TaxID=412755 RepID=A0A0F9SSH8_9ZZZZ
MKSELKNIKFEKLSELKKIRYNLGCIMFNQFLSFLIILVGTVFAASLVFLKTAFLAGVLMMIIGLFLFFSGLYVLYKKEKSLDGFLLEKSK